MELILQQPNPIEHDYRAPVLVDLVEDLAADQFGVVGDCGSTSGFWKSGVRAKGIMAFRYGMRNV